MVYVSVASSPTTSMPSTKFADERLALRERPFLQELPEVRHIPLDLLGGGKLHPPLLQLSGGVVSRSLKLLLSVPQREDSGRQDLQRQLARFKGLVEPLQTLPHVP